MDDSKTVASLKIAWISFLFLDLNLHRTSQLEILKNLEKHGYKTNLVALYSKNKVQTGKLPGNITSIPFRYLPGISPLMFSILLFFYLPFYIVISKPDIIIAEPDVSIIGFISSFPFLKSKRIKLILDVRSTPVETRGFLGKIRTLFFSISILVARKLFNGMTILTPLMKKEVCQKFNINPKFVGVWSSGVSADLFDPSIYSSDGEKLRRKLGLSKKFVIFYHGIFSENRGLNETIDSMNIVKYKCPDVVFFLLGNGPIAKNLKDLVQEKGLQDNVIIHDSVDYTDVPKYIAMSDVGIVPLPNHVYWRFQCPLKMLEYLAMEKVVVATDIPAHRSIIGETKCGIYITSIRPSEIAKAIEYTYHNKERIAEWGKFGRSIIENGYTWEKIARDLEKYLLSLDQKVR